MLRSLAGSGGALTGRPLRLVVTAGLSLMAVGLATVAVAWACSPTARITVTGPTPPGDSPSRAAGPAGSTATVQGSDFADGPVEVHWNSTNGPVLATEPGPDRSPTIQIRIPDEAPGIYYVVAVGRLPDGTVAGKASGSFEITAPPAKSAPVAAPPASSPAGPVANRQSGSAPSTDVAGPRPNQRSGTERKATSGREPTSGDRSRRTAGGGGAQTPATSGRPDATQRFFDGSPGATKAGAVKTGAATAKQRPGSSARQGEAGDAREKAPSAAKKGPSLDTGSDYLTPPGGREPTSWMSVGLGLLGLGLVALLGGFLLAEVRRRRASAEAPRWPLS